MSLLKSLSDLISEDRNILFSYKILKCILIGQFSYEISEFFFNVFLKSHS